MNTHSPPSHPRLSVAIILAWAVVGYGLVWWRLSRQEAA